MVVVIISPVEPHDLPHPDPERRIAQRLVHAPLVVMAVKQSLRPERGREVIDNREAEWVRSWGLVGHAQVGLERRHGVDRVRKIVLEWTSRWLARRRSTSGAMAASSTRA